MNSSDRRAEPPFDDMIEAGWLVALAVVPLFFNPFSIRSFEPDKIAVLRVLVLVMGGVWLVRTAFGGCSCGRRGPCSIPWSVLAPVAATVACAVLSSTLSVDPDLSWWGSYLRGQGTVTLIAYVVVFLLVAGNLRRVDQWRRAAYVVVLTAVSVSLYALMQGAGTDPLAWAESFGRSSSTLGNPIFLGGFLVMAIFVTVGELVDSAVALAGDVEGSSGGVSFAGSGVLRTGFLVFAVVVEVAAVIRAGSRGPLLGLVAGIFMACLLSVLALRAGSGVVRLQLGWWRLGARWSRPAVVAAGLGAVALLVAVGMLGALSSPGPASSRLARTFDAESRTARVRINLWGAVLEMLRSSDPLPIRADKPDSLHPARRLVGYGPETLQLSLNRFLPEELIRLEKRGMVPDRAHNAVYDQLDATGFLGVVVWLWLMLAILQWGMLGCLPGITARQRGWLWFAGGGMTATAVAVSRTVTGTWLWSGLAVPVGLLLGFAAWAAWVFAAAGRQGQGAIVGGMRARIAIVVIAAVTAHLVETSFSFTTAATGLYLWFLAGTAVGMGRGGVADADRARSGRVSPGVAGALCAGLLAAVVCITVFFGLATVMGGASETAGAAAGGVWRLLALIWVAFLIMTLTSVSDRARFPVVPRIVVFTVASVIPALGFVVGLALSQLDSPLRGDQTALAERISWLPVHYVWAVLIGTAAVAVTLGRGRYGGKPNRVAVAVAALVPVAIGIATPTIFRPVRADVVAKYARAALKGDRPDVALELARRAIELAPGEDAFFSLEGQAAMASAGTATDSAQAVAVLEIGETGLAGAVDLRPLDPGHVANLARLRVVMAERVSPLERRAQLEHQAAVGFKRALQLRPGSAEYLAGLGGLMLRRGENTEAAVVLQEAVRRDDRYVPASLALAQCHEAMAREAVSTGENARAAEHRRAAVGVVRRALRAVPDSNRLRSALAALTSPMSDPQTRAGPAPTVDD